LRLACKFEIIQINYQSTLPSPIHEGVTRRTFGF